MYTCRRCGFESDSERDFKEHLRFQHFGANAKESAIDYFIEQLFCNTNNLTPNGDDRADTSMQSKPIEQTSFYAATLMAPHTTTTNMIGPETMSNYGMANESCESLHK